MIRDVYIWSTTVNIWKRALCVLAIISTFQPTGNRNIRIIISLRTLTGNNSLFLRSYLFIHERHREREAETKAEGEAGSPQGTQWGTPSQDSRITTWARSRPSTTEPPRHPSCIRIYIPLGLVEAVGPSSPTYFSLYHLYPTPTHTLALLPNPSGCLSTAHPFCRLSPSASPSGNGSFCSLGTCNTSSFRSVHRPHLQKGLPWPA